VYATPAFVGRLAHALGVDTNGLPGSEIVRVRFRHGAADLPAFTRAAVAMGAFDTPTSTHLEMHIFVAEKGDYYDIADSLPQNPH